ncbi:MAG TPA: glycosyltransferase family 4 protein [Steroidobacteraceae bacterium]|nr:glycosyltransferase family 4 protein [Steroidobacteraceae bacterium]
MRIAYVINSVEGGGAASPVPQVTGVLRDCGAEVRVFALTRRDGRALPAMIAAGLDPLVRPGGLHDHRAALRWLARETGAWGATHLWTSLTRATVLGLLLGSRRGLPVFCWQHAAYLKTGNRLMLRALQKRAQLWIADSETVAQLTQRRLGVPQSRLLTWPIFAADAAAPVAAPWEPGQPLRLGSLGRLHPVKGYDILIAALAMLRREGFRPPVPCSVTLAGEGGERARLEGAARAAGIEDLLLPGFVAQPRHFLAGLHLYLQPSRSEGFCIAAHEAMVAALPVLASAAGELPRTIIEGVTGHTVPPGDVGALAGHLHMLLSRPQQLHRMGSAARARALELFAPARFVRAGRELFGRMAAASSTGLREADFHPQARIRVE